MRNVTITFSLCAVLSGCLWETTESRYASMAEAASEGAVEKGWIPEWIPASAAGIHEVHNIDSNVSALYFELPADEPWDLPSHCVPTRFADVYQPTLSRSWWPSAEEQARDFVFHRCRVDTPLSLIQIWAGRSRMGERALFWRTGTTSPG